MALTAVVQAPVVNRSFGFFGASQRDVRAAADDLRRHLTGLDAAGVESALQSVVNWTDRLLVMPGTRKDVILTLDKLSAALDMVPRASHSPADMKEVARLFDEALQTQKAISGKISGDIKHDSKLLAIRNVITPILFLIGVAAFVAINIIFPGSGLAFLALTALGPGGLLFVWGRINDNLGTPCHAAKCLKALSDEITATTQKTEKEIMLHAVGRLETKFETVFDTVVETVSQNFEALEARNASLERSNASLENEVHQMRLQLQQMIALLTPPQKVEQGRRSSLGAEGQPEKIWLA